MDISASLGCMIIAEGVEEADQASKLKSLGVHSQQGYYHSKPMEYDQLNGFLKYSEKHVKTEPLV